MATVTLNRIFFIAVNPLRHYFYDLSKNFLARSLARSLGGSPWVNRGPVTSDSDTINARAEA